MFLISRTINFLKILEKAFANKKPCLLPLGVLRVPRTTFYKRENSWRVEKQNERNQ